MIKSFTFIILLSSFSASAADCVRHYYTDDSNALYDRLAYYRGLETSPELCATLYQGFVIVSNIEIQDFISTTVFDSSYFSSQNGFTCNSFSYTPDDGGLFRSVYLTTQNTNYSQCESVGGLVYFLQPNLYNSLIEESNQLEFPIDSDLTDTDTLENIQNILLITLLLTALIHGFSTGNKRD